MHEETKKSEYFHQSHLHMNKPPNYQPVEKQAPNPKKNGEIQKRQIKLTIKTRAKTHKRIHPAWWGIRIPVSCALWQYFHLGGRQVNHYLNQAFYHWTSVRSLTQIINVWWVSYHIFERRRKEGRKEWIVCLFVWVCRVEMRRWWMVADVMEGWRDLSRLTIYSARCL